MTTPPDPQDARWLSPDENLTWVRLSEVMTRLPSALDSQLTRDAGISYYEYMVLAMLSEQHDRTLGMGQLARLTSGSLSRLSHVVKRLEKQGFVRREASQRDRRHTNAILTDAGYDKIVASAPGHVEMVRHLVFDALTADQAHHLQEAVTLVRHQIDPADEWRIAPDSPTV